VLDVPDALFEDRTKTLFLLTDEIRKLPRLTDEQFQKKLMPLKAALSAEADRN
jgi:hypothetical protein